MPQVICQNGCRGRFHETTELFDPEVYPHGGMFRLMEPYRGNGWSSFPEHVGVTGAALECPDCGAPYLNSSNRVKLDGEVVKKDAPKKDATKAGEITQETIDKILAMTAEGKKPGEIGAAIGLSHMKVGALIKKHTPPKE